MNEVELIASEFHRFYEELAPEFGYKTRDASAVPWDQVPEDNRKLMMATVDRLITSGTVSIGAIVEEAMRQQAGQAPSFSIPETMQSRIKQVTTDLDQQAAERSGQTQEG